MAVDQALDHADGIGAVLFLRDHRERGVFPVSYTHLTLPTSDLV